MSEIFENELYHQLRDIQEHPEKHRHVNFDEFCDCVKLGDGSGEGLLINAHWVAHSAHDTIRGHCCCGAFHEGYTKAADEFPGEITLRKLPKVKELRVAVGEGAVLVLVRTIQPMSHNVYHGPKPDYVIPLDDLYQYYTYMSVNDYYRIFHNI